MCFCFIGAAWLDLYLWKYHKICWLHQWVYSEIYEDYECERCGLEGVEFFKNK